MRSSLIITAAAAVLALAAGCGETGTPGAAEPGPEITSATTGPSSPAAPEPTGEAESCADETSGWNTDPETDDTMSTAPVFKSRIGQHECYDRVVFDLNGAGPVGYDVRYVPVVTQDGSGNPVPVAGDAALQVVVRAPAQGAPGDTTGHQPGVIFAPSGAALHGPGGLENWGCLREVRSAGSFEGQTTFAVGVRAELPFRLDTWTDSDQITHVVVDIACSE